MEEDDDDGCIINLTEVCTESVGVGPFQKSLMISLELLKLAKQSILF